MQAIRFIDVTVRDGQQSLWATRMTNAMLLPALPRMDRMGFAWIDLVGGAVFDVCVRYLGEDPWERMRLAAAELSETPLNVWTRGQSLFTFEFFPDDIVGLTLERSAANGMKRLTTYDALNDIRNIAHSVKTAKNAGMYASGHVVYTVSPVHTDGYYEKKAQEIIALGVDSLGIKDPSGLLTPERARTLVPALKKVAGDLPLELHSHCRSGLGELVYLEAAAQGIDILHTGVRPLASGDALPDARYVMRHLRESGFDIGIEDTELAGLEDYFFEVAELHGKPIGRPQPYDPFLYHHQVPGGMISNLRSQLADIGMEDRLNAVLEEAGQVREDLGYPILVSPFAQFVVTQAVINVVQGERYATIPDEVARYVLGYYGEIAGTVSAEVEERVRASAGDAEPVTERPGALVPPRIAKLKGEHGPFESDDELLLAAFYQPAQLETFYAARDLPDDRRTNAALPGSSLKGTLELLANMPSTPGSYSIRHDGLDLQCTR